MHQYEYEYIYMILLAGFVGFRHVLLSPLSVIEYTLSLSAKFCPKIIAVSVLSSTKKMLSFVISVSDGDESTPLIALNESFPSKHSVLIGLVETVSFNLSTDGRRITWERANKPGENLLTLASEKALSTTAIEANRATDRPRDQSVRCVSFGKRQDVTKSAWLLDENCRTERRLYSSTRPTEANHAGTSII